LQCRGDAVTVTQDGWTNYLTSAQLSDNISFSLIILLAH
jgi:hypothetical protein